MRGRRLEGHMKIRTLIASVAFIALGTAVAGAADLAVKAAPPPPVAVLNWTGFYVGINLGGAWSHNNWTDTVLLTNFNNNCNNSAGGWLVGAGAEWAFAPHWSLKFEYDYLGLGNRTFTVPVTAPLLAGDTFTSNNRNFQMVKIGVNYLWNWGYNRY